MGGYINAVGDDVECWVAASVHMAGDTVQDLMPSFTRTLSRVDGRYCCAVFSLFTYPIAATDQDCGAPISQCYATNLPRSLK